MKVDEKCKYELTEIKTMLIINICFYLPTFNWSNMIEGLHIGVSLWCSTNRCCWFESWNRLVTIVAFSNFVFLFFASNLSSILGKIHLFPVIPTLQRQKSTHFNSRSSGTPLQDGLHMWVWVNVASPKQQLARHELELASFTQELN